MDKIANELAKMKLELNNSLLVFLQPQNEPPMFQIGTLAPKTLKNTPF